MTPTFKGPARPMRRLIGGVPTTGRGMANMREMEAIKNAMAQVSPTASSQMMDAQKTALAKKDAEARQAAANATAPDKDINMLPTPVVRSAAPPMSDMEKMAQGQNTALDANSAQNAAQVAAMQQAAQSASALQKQQAPGPAIMPTPMKRGGSVKAYKAGGAVSSKKESVRGWGIARGARKAKIV